MILPTLNGLINIANMGIGYEQLYIQGIRPMAVQTSTRNAGSFQQDISAFIKQMGGLTGLNVQNVQNVQSFGSLNISGSSQQYVGDVAEWLRNGRLVGLSALIVW